MSAAITDSARETARLAVSLVLKDEEAAWESVAQLIADHSEESNAAHQSKAGSCPTCKRPLNLALPKRFCSACGQQITRHHKWQIGDDGRIRHRVCERPDSYR